MATIPWRKLKDEVGKKVEDSSTFLLAISGGVDSMVLLNFFNRTIGHDKFIVAHFNHCIRDESSIEEKYLIEYCEKNDIRLHVGHGIELDFSSTEEACRDQRWKFLEDIQKEYNCSHIVTGHHKNDEIENFLFRLMRGSDITSLCMKKETQFPNYIRYKPFLDVMKNDIRNYADRNDITYFEDHTNQENDHTRNKIRNELIPHMMEFANIEKTIPKIIEQLKHNVG